jgi:hypothetical protein
VEGMMFKGDAASQMNLNATYEELKSKGVVFKKPPTKEFYAYEALFLDDSVNWFSLGEKEEEK